MNAHIIGWEVCVASQEITSFYIDRLIDIVQDDGIISYERVFGFIWQKSNIATISSCSEHFNFAKISSGETVILNTKKILPIGHKLQVRKIKLAYKNKYAEVVPSLYDYNIENMLLTKQQTEIIKNFPVSNSEVMQKIFSYFKMYKDDFSLIFQQNCLLIFFQKQLQTINKKIISKCQNILPVENFKSEFIEQFNCYFSFDNDISFVIDECEAATLIDIDHKKGKFKHKDFFVKGKELLLKIISTIYKKNINGQIIIDLPITSESFLQIRKIIKDTIASINDIHFQDFTRGGLLIITKQRKFLSNQEKYTNLDIHNFNNKSFNHKFYLIEFDIDLYLFMQRYKSIKELVISEIIYKAMLPVLENLRKYYPFKITISNENKYYFKN